MLERPREATEPPKSEFLPPACPFTGARAWLARGRQQPSMSEELCIMGPCVPSPDAGHGVSQLRSAARAQTSANSQLREAQASPAGARAQRGGSLCRRRVPDLAAAGRAVARTMVVEGSAAP